MASFERDKRVYGKYKVNKYFVYVIFKTRYH